MLCNGPNILLQMLSKKKLFLGFLILRSHQLLPIFADLSLSMPICRSLDFTSLVSRPEKSRLGSSRAKCLVLAVEPAIFCAQFAWQNVCNEFQKSFSDVYIIQI